VLLVARLRAVTVAPGTLPPDWSLTRPPIAPSVVDCAKSGAAAPSINTHAAPIAHARRDHFTCFIAELLRNELRGKP